MSKSYEACIDWLNVIVRTTAPKLLLKNLSEIDSHLDFDCFTCFPDRGTYNYSFTLIHNVCPLRIAWNPVSDYLHCPGDDFIACDQGESNNPFVFISFSGDALRYFNNRGHLAEIFKLFGDYGCSSSRLDVALDLFEESPVVGLLEEAVRYTVNFQKGKPTLKTKLNRTKPDNFLLYEYSDPDTSESFYNIQIGNHSSSFGMFRCYNKLFEVKYGRLKEFSDQILSSHNLSRNGYWWRLEYELHKDRADQLFQLLLSDLQTSDDCFMSAFLSVSTTMFTPVVLEDMTITRNDTCEEWVEFIEELSKTIHFVQLGSIPYVPHNSLPRFEKNLLNISGYIYAAISYLSAFDTFREEFYKKGRCKFETLNRYAYIRQGIEDLKGGEAS